MDDELTPDFDMNSSGKTYERLDQTLSNIISGEDGSVVSKWVVVLETVSFDHPNPSLRILSNLNNRPWDMEGMLSYASRQLDAFEYVDLGGDDDVEQ